MRTVEGEPYADVLSMMLLRSMQQARYSGAQSRPLWTCCRLLHSLHQPDSPLSRPSSSPYDSGLRPFQGNNRAFWASDSRLRPSLQPRASLPLRLSVKSKPWKRLSIWKNTWVKSMMQLCLVSLNLVSLSNCQTQLKAWFTSLIYLNFIISTNVIWLFVEKIRNNLPCRATDSVSELKEPNKMTGEIDFIYPKWVWCDWKGLKTV